MDQQALQLREACPEHIDPGRSIRQDHAVVERRRGIGFKPGIVPASDANRRALSRSIKACKPACNSAVFSLVPVNSRALSINSSSRINVVLICIIMHYLYASVKPLARTRRDKPRIDT